MPIRKDATGTRRVEMEFITPGTPDQVWRAMATGPGNAAWFTARGTFRTGPTVSIWCECYRVHVRRALCCAPTGRRAAD